MNLKNVEKHEKNMVTMTVEVGKDEFAPAIEKAYKKQVKQMKIPGFRPGHAPRKVIEGMYGVEIFFDEAMNFAFPEAYQAALEEAKLEPVEHPQVEVTEVSADGFTFKATFANYPEVKLGEYKGLSAEKPSVEVGDEDVDKKLQQMRERNARLVSVEREAQNGDTAVIDFEGKKDGVPFDGGKGESYPLELGSGSFIPGFEEQIVGMKAGDEKDIDVTFPEDYQAEELAGKPVVFSIKLHEVKAKDMPELDDEFAKDVSEFDTLEELKADLRKKEEESREASAKQAFENNLMELVAANMECDIPEAMVENQARRVVDDYKMQVQSQGMRFADYLQMTGMKESDLLDSAKEPALRQLRGSLALEAIIKAENIEATEEEVDAEMQKMADQYGLSLEDVKKYLRSADVEEQIKREKALKLVVDSASVKAAE
ncbi:MAG: trigger factor [Clostridiales bacterium]|nr:trigger factor [bacterium 210917-SL.2.15]MCI5844087.1 trigger factor [Clostridiales bacterium]MDY4035936.1 trigger factor [Candidatus Pseudoscilispira sp.]